MAGEAPSSAEERIGHAFALGSSVDFIADGTSGLDGQIRGEALAALLSGSGKPDVAQGSIRIRGATVNGPIQLLGIRSPHAIFLQDCSIKDGLDLRNSTIGTLSLTHCRLSRIDLEASTIVGELDLTGTELTSTGPFALRGDGVSVTGSVNCTGLNTYSQIRFDRASVSGDLTLNGATIRAQEGPAVWADRLSVAHNIYCGPSAEGQPFSIEGGFRLIWATVGAQLVLRSARLTAPGRVSLDGHGLSVAGDMICDKQFHSTGEVHLDLAKIGGLLSFDDAELVNGRSIALFAAGLVVAGAMIGHKVQVHGTFDVTGANVRELDLDGALLLCRRQQTALSAAGLTVELDLSCQAPFRAEGQVVLTGASIGGNLLLNGAWLVCESGAALSADRVRVGQNMLCGKVGSVGEAFRADGVRLMWASIGGQLVLRGARLKGTPGLNRQLGSPSGRVGVQVEIVVPPVRALNAYGLSVTGDMVCDGGYEATDGVTLEHARIGVIIDNPTSWPSNLESDGLVYDDLQPYMAARDRLRWMTNTVKYKGQPYERLASYYRGLGHDDEARRVLYARERARTRLRPWWWRWTRWIQGGLVGYGYMPQRAVLYLLAAFCGGYLFFQSHPVAPVDAGSHSAYNPALYTIDSLIPAPVVGDPNQWNPLGIALLIALTLRLIGWLLTISIVAAVVRILRRD